MRYITSKDSETGMKFNAIADKRDQIYGAIEVILDELGIDEYRQGYWTAIGGISSLVYPKDKEVPTYLKKVVNNEYMPKLNTKKGKQLQARIDALPLVSNIELNSCIGFQNRFSTVGVKFNHPKWYIFEVDENWDVEVPIDCEEITKERYKELLREINHEQD